MKKLLLMLLLATFVASGSVIAQNNDNAKSKKEKKEKKEKSPSKFGAFITRTGERATGINMTNEPFVVNPSSMSFDVEFVGAYGISSTGHVTIIFKVKNKTNYTGASFGGSTNNAGKTVAFDVKGKTYGTGTVGSKTFDVAKGIWTEIVLEGLRGFEKVPSTLNAFELINMSYYFDSKVQGLMEFRNIPIQWDVVPE